MKHSAALREARALSLTRNARFCVYGYRTVQGTWTYSFHARRPLCEIRETPTHPARADRPCPVCGNYPTHCTCRITDDSPRARAEAPLMYDDTVWPEGGVQSLAEAFALEMTAWGIEEDNG